MTDYDGSPGEMTDQSDHDEYDHPENKMLKDRANRGSNADNIQANRNNELKNRALRGAFIQAKAAREAP